MSSPHDLLPAIDPRNESPPLDYFYNNVSKHLIKDVVRIMANGIPISLPKVRELENVLDNVIASVHTTLENNAIVREYQQIRYKRIVDAYIEDRRSHFKSPSDFIVEFSAKKSDHRSYFMHIFSQATEISTPTELLPSGIPKWSANQVKIFAKTRPILQRMLNHELNESNSNYVRDAMQLLAEHKADIHNRKYQQQIDTLSSVELPPFNPGSPDQKHDIFSDMLGYESNKLTDAYKKYEKDLKYAQRYNKPLPEPPKNQYSWDRDNIEAVMKLTDDPIEQELCQALIDYSFGAIVKNNFIQAFYKYTVNGRLHGELKLFGAKSFRLTSNNPNLLNAPSSKSIYSKPIKRCFIAPKGYVILTADYAALNTSGVLYSNI